MFSKKQCGTEQITKDNRVVGFDFIRTAAILIVFIGHIINRQSDNQALLLTFRSLSPGLTMSLLGFISPILLTKQFQNIFDSSYYFRRLTRIYISLFLCLTLLFLHLILLGKDVINLHSALHFMGLSLFFDIFMVDSKSPLRLDLWFVSIIIIMYLLLPFLSQLFRHRNGFVHLVILILFFFFLDFSIYRIASAWNVAISF